MKEVEDQLATIDAMGRLGLDVPWWREDMFEICRDVARREVERAIPEMFIGAFVVSYKHALRLARSLGHGLYVSAAVHGARSKKRGVAVLRVDSSRWSEAKRGVVLQSGGPEALWNSYQELEPATLKVQVRNDFLGAGHVGYCHDETVIAALSKVDLLGSGPPHMSNGACAEWSHRFDPNGQGFARAIRLPSLAGALGTK